MTYEEAFEEFVKTTKELAKVVVEMSRRIRIIEEKIQEFENEN